MTSKNAEMCFTIKKSFKNKKTKKKEFVKMY